MPIEIKPFEVQHLSLFNLKLGEEWMASFFDIKTLAIEYAKRGQLFSVFVDDRVEAIGGFVKLWEGVVEMIAMISPVGKRHIKIIHRTAKNMINVALSNGIWRIQTNVLDGFDKGIRWVERLGFHSEGKMKKYTPDGRDMIRFAIVKGG
jgi:hypothetical protein